MFSTIAQNRQNSTIELTLIVCVCVCVCGGGGGQEPGQGQGLWSYRALSSGCAFFQE